MLERWKFDGKLSYKQDAPQNTSRAKVLALHLSAASAFNVGAMPFSYESLFRLQWNTKSLIYNDKFSIDGRYTVRGFDGEQSLVGARGFYWQNTLSWHWHSRHQIYFGVDYGRLLDKKRTKVWVTARKMMQLAC